MGLFDFIGSIFKPAVDLVDELHFSGEEEAAAKNKAAELRNKLAEIQAQTATKMMELQLAAIQANAKVAEAEQANGNWLSKSHRPITSLAMTTVIMLMAFGVIEFREIVMQICGAYLGIYGIGRSMEKAKKK